MEPSKFQQFTIYPGKLSLRLGLKLCFGVQGRTKNHQPRISWLEEMMPINFFKGMLSQCAWIYLNLYYVHLMMCGENDAAVLDSEVRQMTLPASLVNIQLREFGSWSSSMHPASIFFTRILNWDLCFASLSFVLPAKYNAQKKVKAKDWKRPCRIALY